MAETIRRGSARPVRRQGAVKGRKGSRSRSPGGWAMDALVRVLPFTEAQLRAVFLALILALLAAAALLAASFAGLPQMAGQRVAQAVGDAGFTVRQVEVRGVERLDEMAVYERVLGVHDRAMPLVSLSQMRASLEALPWVREARVSRQLPDTIIVDIVEREPRAVLRTAKGFALVDETGRRLEYVRPDQARGTLMVSGDGVAERLGALEELLSATPMLRPRVVEAEWIGNRRWDLTFATGQVLALPEGEERSRTALLSFAQLDDRRQLLGGRVAAFDMRNPERAYMRVPGRAAEAEAAAAALAAAAEDS